MGIVPTAHFDVKPSGADLAVEATIDSNVCEPHLVTSALGRLPDIRDLRMELLARSKVPPRTEVELDGIARGDRRIGTSLLELLLSDRVTRGAFQQAVSAASSRAIFVCEIRVSEPFSQYPWEACAYADWKSLGMRPPTAKTVVVRTPLPPLQSWNAVEPIRIMVAGASPRGTPTPNFDKEFEAIRRALSSLREGRYRCEPVRSASIQRLRSEIRQRQPHVVHLVAHGDPGHVQVEGYAEEPMRVNGTDLVLALGPAEGCLSLFVTTACMAMQEMSGQHSLALGKALSRHVPLTIGMQLAIQEETARTFSAEFYSALARSSSVLEAYAWARDTIIKARPGSPEWIAPVLFRGTVDYADRYLFGSQDVLLFLQGVVNQLYEKTAILRHDVWNLSVWNQVKAILTEVDGELVDGYDRGRFYLGGRQEGALRRVEREIAEVRGYLTSVEDMLLDAGGVETRLKFDFGPVSSHLLTHLRALRRELEELLALFG